VVYTRLVLTDGLFSNVGPERLNRGGPRMDALQMNSSLPLGGASFEEGGMYLDDDRESQADGKKIIHKDFFNSEFTIGLMSR